MHLLSILFSKAIVTICFGCHGDSWLPAMKGVLFGGIKGVWVQGFFNFHTVRKAISSVEHLYTSPTYNWNIFITLWNFPFYFLSLPFLRFNLLSKVLTKTTAKGFHLLLFCRMAGHSLWEEYYLKKQLNNLRKWWIIELYSGGGRGYILSGQGTLWTPIHKPLSQWPAQAAKDWVPLGFRHWFWYLQRQLLDSALNC